MLVQLEFRTWLVFAQVPKYRFDAVEASLSVVALLAAAPDAPSASLDDCGPQAGRSPSRAPRRMARFFVTGIAIPSCPHRGDSEI
jgi:hypothetical protein